MSSDNDAKSIAQTAPVFIPLSPAIQPYDTPAPEPAPEPVKTEVSLVDPDVPKPIHRKLIAMSANRFISKIRPSYPDARNIHVSFNSYRKTPYGFAIRPILIQMQYVNYDDDGDKDYSTQNLTYADFPIDEIYIKLGHIEKSYLHEIVFGFDEQGEYLGWYTQSTDYDPYYKDIAQRMKNKWKPPVEHNDHKLDLTAFT